MTTAAKTAAKDTNLVKQSGGDLLLPESDLDFFSGACEDNVSDYDVKYNRIQIMQPNSPEIARGETGYKAGMLITHLDREIITTYCKQPWLVGKVDDADISQVHCVEILPIFKLPTEYIAWNSIQERQASNELWKFKTLDKKDPRVVAGLPAWRGGKWKRTDSSNKPPVTENLNILCMPLEDGEFFGSPVIATFSRTSFTTGQKLTNFCVTHRHNRLPWWGKSYWLYTQREEKEISGQVTVYNVIKVAKGRGLKDLPEWGEKHAVLMETAKWLADREQGRERQEQLINAAEFIDDTDTSQSGADELADDFFGDDDTSEKGESPF